MVEEHETNSSGYKIDSTTFSYRTLSRLGAQEIMSRYEMSPESFDQYKLLQQSIADVVKQKARVGKYIDFELLLDGHVDFDTDFIASGMFGFDTDFIREQARSLSHVYVSNVSVQDKDAVAHLCLPKRVTLYLTLGAIQITSIPILDQYVHEGVFDIPANVAAEDVFRITPEDKRFIANSLNEWKKLPS